MRKDELEKLRALRVEVDELSKNIISFSPKVVVDSVTGSTPERLDKHVIPIQGINMKEYQRLESKISKKTCELLRQISKMEEWLCKVEDSEMRTILRLRYQKGKSWSEIGKALGYDRRTVARKCEIFFESECVRNKNRGV